MTIEEMRSSGEHLDRTIRRRNFFEYLAVAYVAGSFAWRAVVAQSALVLIGDALVAVASLFVAYQLSQRGSARAIPKAMDPGGYAAAYRAELCRQRDALRDVPLWYIGPFVPGLVLLLIGRIVELHAAHWTRALAGSAVVAFVFGVVWFINGLAARRMQWRIDELDASLQPPG